MLSFSFSRNLSEVNMFSIFKNIFTVVCLVITLVLIIDLLYVFVEEKPTTTTKLKEELTITDMPDVVVCMDLGFNNVSLKKYGYRHDTYWLGENTKEKSSIDYHSAQ